MITMIANSYEVAASTVLGTPTGHYEVRLTGSEAVYGYRVATYGVRTREQAEQLAETFRAEAPEGFERTHVGLNEPYNLINWASRVQVWFGSMFGRFYVGVVASVRNSGVKCLKQFDTLGEAVAFARTLIPAETERLNRVHARALKADADRVRTWSKISGVNAWQASDGRVIVKTPRKRLGRNGFRVAGYELSASKSGPALGFFLTLSDAKGAK